MSTKKHIAASGASKGQFVTCSANRCTLTGGFHSTSRELILVQQHIINTTGRKITSARLTEEQVLRFRLLSAEDRKSVVDSVDQRIKNRHLERLEAAKQRNIRNSQYAAEREAERETRLKDQEEIKIYRKFGVSRNLLTDNWEKTLTTLSAAGEQRKALQQVFKTLKEGGCEITYDEDKGFLRTEYTNIKIVAEKPEALVAFSMWVQQNHRKSIVPAD